MQRCLRLEPVQVISRHVEQLLSLLEAAKLNHLAHVGARKLVVACVLFHVFNPELPPLQQVFPAMLHHVVESLLSHSSCRHLQTEVVRVVYELEDGSRRVVADAVAVEVKSSVASGAVSVASGELLQLR